MAQDAGMGSSHVVVDIVQEAGQQSSCCAVCTEPLEWVAVFPCGHREVCAACAARIRFLQGDLRCSICRSHCPTVLVTKATSHQEATPFLWRPSFGREKPLYHAGMGAYFDDLCQYQEMSKVCAKSPRSSADLSEESVCLDVQAALSQPAASLNVNTQQRAPPQPTDDEDESLCDVGTVFIYIAIIQAIFTFFAILFVVAQHPYQKVLAVLGFVVFASGYTVATVYILRIKPNPSSEGRTTPRHPTVLPRIE